MLAYPQLGSGALSQFPVQKRRRPRTVVNRAADGSTIKLADPMGAVLEWTLPYSALTDGEVEALQQFFASAEGTLNGFTFLDPTGNLLAWSDQLDQEAWQRDPQLSLAAGIADPQGGTKAWHVANGGGGPQTITQALAAPGGYVYCLSAYVRSAQATSVTMLLGSQRAERAVAAEWRRIVFAASGDAAAESVGFGLEIPAGAALDVYGMQAEPSAGASLYQASTTGGVYEGARLRDDALAITTTGENRHSATVNIIHANHL